MDRRRSSGRALSASHRLITDAGGVAQVAEALAGVGRYALDTEFHRERTYFPKLALVQIAWDDQIVLIDPLEVDLDPLVDVLEGPATAVIHAASQDLEVLVTHLGAVPTRLWDTQVAAGFLGLSTPSLSTLVDRELGIALPKGDRLTDWLQRPLRSTQLDYAASDVEHLLEIQDRQLADLTELGRVEWSTDECELLRQANAEPRDPDRAWLRVKEARKLKGRDAAMARAVAGWRERRAAEIDRPVRQVLSDMAVATVAQRQPKDPDELASARGVDKGFARSRPGRDLIAAVAAAADDPVPEVKAAPSIGRDQRAAVTLASAWLSQWARDLRLDPTLLATRSDLESYLADDPDSRLRRGWRAEVVGRVLDRLTGGEVALAFDGRGGLVLEERSHRPAAEIESPAGKRDVSGEITP